MGGDGKKRTMSSVTSHWFHDIQEAHTKGICLLEACKRRYVRTPFVYMIAFSWGFRWALRVDPYDPHRNIKPFYESSGEASKPVHKPPSRPSWEVDQG